ncbi:chemotaxis signal transduction protein [Salinibacter ruber]|uniref:Chemotaxis signal transduction protein n=1 Tax=Salinibacter ruber TaxID=146919 RepID=A0A9X3A0L6_9BACT|nr:chemotaxis signal transduction protein [Salinibacter ruber]MCS3616933.1 chemotaxis signal transduction protein [Salinibacter ruber]MCS3676072.1 chemotaxis signal transduction protein [Salinibacter ruber]MCS3785755.1 chemotaxis signal transduction protein [Salinibacter ruber]MCS4038336.1 chemotaxis signal transduction protein [Salinibacter ruber]
MNEQRSRPGKAKQLVSFAVGGEDFGIDILSVQEIIRPVEVTSSPMP